MCCRTGAALEEENDSPSVSAATAVVRDSSKQTSTKSRRASRMPRLLVIHDQHALQVHEEGANDGGESLWKTGDQVNDAAARVGSRRVNRKAKCDVFVCWKGGRLEPRV